MENNEKIEAPNSVYSNDSNYSNELLNSNEDFIPPSENSIEMNYSNDHINFDIQPDDNNNRIKCCESKVDEDDECKSMDVRSICSVG